ncbi:ATP-dependent zinc metalloprotease FTSH 11 [Hibiscus syriacus]|uniref:ATP-dependent zinc metalloprotease FTSH 11 n=1 Tax=Hibiscus syriacus TaxID=106335 RepID=A0A6A3CA31_HIBSY|nr:ATP-dependent zinc metalloprotease FTSH 11 [Hibiscus syriacus]
MGSWLMDRQNLVAGAQGQTRSAGSGGVISRTCGSSADPSRQIFEVDFSGRALGESDTDGFKNIISQWTTNPYLPVSPSAIDGSSQLSLGLDGEKLEPESNVLLASSRTCSMLLPWICSHFTQLLLPRKPWKGTAYMMEDFANCITDFSIKVSNDRSRDYTVPQPWFSGNSQFKQWASGVPGVPQSTPVEMANGPTASMPQMTPGTMQMPGSYSGIPPAGSVPPYGPNQMKRKRKRKKKKKKKKEPQILLSLNPRKPRFHRLYYPLSLKLKPFSPSPVFIFSRLYPRPFSIPSSSLHPDNVTSDFNGEDSQPLVSDSQPLVSDSDVVVDGFENVDEGVEVNSVDGESENAVDNGQSDELVVGNEGSKSKIPSMLFFMGIWAMIKNGMDKLLALDWFSWWPFWRKEKRLDRLIAEADANPRDAAKHSALLAELNKHSPESVIKRFEQRDHAVDSRGVAEYLRALIVTNAIAEYLPDEQAGKPSSLPTLLQELKQRASGNVDEPFLSPGISQKQPLHVVMVDPKFANRSRFAQELISTILFTIAVGLVWFMGASALQRYVGSLGGIGTSGVGSSSSYAPKELNKEVMPEKASCDDAKQELEEVVEYLKNPSKFTRLGGKLPKGILLTGAPGTGKTLLAKAIAGEAGVPFFYRAGSEFEEMFVGVGARRVRSLFQAAKKKGIILMAATNLPDILDPALTRPGRFDRHIVVPNPDVRGRQQILELYLQDKPLSDDVDVKAIARGTPGFNGADLANLVNIAAIKAAVEGANKLTASQLEHAKDRILMGTERKTMFLSEDSKKLTAYHESGHAIVAFNTEGALPIHKATIMPRGSALGMVTQLPSTDETSISKKQLLARLDVCMGGRVAEELIFGQDHITTGASSDLHTATELAQYMVSSCGMSDAIGPVNIKERPSSEMQSRIDAEVVKLLREAYDRVKALLKKQEKALHELANALLEYETLNAEEIKRILLPFREGPFPEQQEAQEEGELGKLCTMYFKQHRRDHSMLRVESHFEMYHSGAKF